MMRFNALITLLTFIVGIFASPFALADELNPANTSWILTSTALVLFMTLPGLALFYGGLVRNKNVLSVLMQCFAIAGVASIVWLVVGYSLAFSGSNGFIGNLDKVFFSGIFEETLSGDIPESLFAMFQMTFAVITPALIVGGFAERIKFSAVLVFSVFWLILVYTPITNWVWGGGWLGSMGLLDFAGGTVVHITAGVAALVVAIMIKPRKGFGTANMTPHNLTLTMAGAGMLWVGWFGFNGGSALAANGDAAMAILVTHISAAAGAVTWMIYEWVKFGKPTALGFATGIIAGLGTITPASGFVGPAGALVIGITAGIVCFNAVIWIKQRLGIDDSLDVFPVHGVGGIIGTFMAGIFASSQLGIFSGQGLAEGITISDQVWIQIIGIASTITWTAVVTFIILKIIDKVVGLRIDASDEETGVDITSHGEKGYHL